jgi:hypothetical protein
MTPESMSNKHTYRSQGTLLGRLLVFLTIAFSALALPTLVNSAWTAAGGLANGRAEHKAVQLNDGRVLVVGGRLWTSAASTADIYDQATGTW